jgi:hypothetical protein
MHFEVSNSLLLLTKDHKDNLQSGRVCVTESGQSHNFKLLKRTGNHTIRIRQGKYLADTTFMANNALPFDLRRRAFSSERNKVSIKTVSTSLALVGLYQLLTVCKQNKVAERTVFLHGL